MKANWLSLGIKILGAVIILVAMILVGMGVWKIGMNDVIAGVLAMQAMVLPIDVSKIKAAGH